MVRKADLDSMSFSALSIRIAAEFGACMHDGGAYILGFRAELIM